MELANSFACIVHWRELHAPSIESLNLWLTGRLTDWLSDWQNVCLAFHFDWYALFYILYYLHKVRKFSKASSQFLKFKSRQCCHCYRRCCCWEAIKADSVHCWLANRTETIRKAARQRVNSIKFPHNCLTNSRKSRTSHIVAYQTSNIYIIYICICHGSA